MPSDTMCTGEDRDDLPELAEHRTYSVSSGCRIQWMASRDQTLAGGTTPPSGDCVPDRSSRTTLEPDSYATRPRACRPAGYEFHKPEVKRAKDQPGTLKTTVTTWEATRKKLDAVRKSGSCIALYVPQKFAERMKIRNPMS